jgi:methionyl-tRNA formyltransferase
MKVGFYLMGFKGYSVLEGVILKLKSVENIRFVVAARDSSILNDYFEEIKELAIKSKILFIEKKFIDNNNSVIHQANYTIAIGWRWLIQNNNNLIVLHDSILPKYRGFNPLVTALINGDNEIGVTAIFAREEFDSGPILGQKIIKVKYPFKIQNAIEIISREYTALTVEIIEKILKNSLKEIVQKEQEATYSLWRDEEDYQINWKNSSEKIKRQIDASGFPYKGAKTIIENRYVRILNAELVDDLKIENRSPGKILKILNGNPIVVCGHGLLILTDMVDDETAEKIYLNKIRLRFK